MDSQRFIDRAMGALARWAKFSERYWNPLKDHLGYGYFGTGYDAWGVQTVQKYVASMATLATSAHPQAADIREWALQRALAALRYNLATHKSGPLCCTDGSKWGHTWISALGIERMMHGVLRIIPMLTHDDCASLRRVLISEARWSYQDHSRYPARGVFGSRWAKDEKNAPESNIWTGALLWRVASMYPEHPESVAWKQRACAYFINGISVPDDEFNEKIVDGLPVKERFRGENFFPNFALDHHHYLNVGYMVICMSNAAMLYFDAKKMGWDVPDSLHHNHSGLWGVLRKMIFSDGRLARIGGDSRIRYSYCQDYLLPALFYAADHLGDAHGVPLAFKQLELFEIEHDRNADGSFYGQRLAHLADSSPYYYTRIESDRAAALAMAINWADALTIPEQEEGDFNASACGQWVEHEHGAVLQRDTNRLASFSWRSYGLTQALCQPPQMGNLAEWDLNLIGRIEFQGDVSAANGGLSRRIETQHIEQFAGGFITSGIIVEGSELFIPESWKSKDSALSYIAVAALPDGQTMLGLHYCQTADRVLYVKDIKGIHLNVPNDLYNGFQRQLQTEKGTIDLKTPSPTALVLNLESQWVTIDEQVGLISFRDPLQVSRSDRQRGGAIGSLYVEEICAPCVTGVHAVAPESVLLDSAWAVLSGGDSKATESFANQNFNRAVGGVGQSYRGILVIGADHRKYCFIANCSEKEVAISLLETCGYAYRANPVAGIGFSQDEPDTIRLTRGGSALLLLIMTD